MAFTRKNSFNGGSDTTTITTGNSGGGSGDAFSSVIGSPRFSATNATGSRAPLVAQCTAATELWWTGISVSARTIYVRAYLYLPSNPGSISTLIRIRASSSDVARVRVNTNGTVHLSNSSASTITATATTNAIPLSRWVRIEARVTVGTTTSNGTCELRVYQSADSSTPAETTSATGQNFGTTLPNEATLCGNPGWYLDDYAVSDIDWIGPDRKDDEATPSTLSGTWSMPTPGISTGAGAAPSTLSGTWSMPTPEITTADGLVAVNPDPLTGMWSTPAPTVQAYKNVLVEPATLVGSWQVLDPAAGVPVNPGDSITGPGQVEWNGFLLGSGTPYRLQQLDGWITDMPGLDSTNVPQPNRHGSYSGRKMAQERIVTFSGLVRARRDEMEQAVQDLLAVTTVPEDDTEYPLAVRLIDTIYVGYGSVTRRSIPVDRQYRLGLARLTLQWTLSDPVLLSRELNSAVISDGATQILSNLGNASSYPLIRVAGPSTSPAVEIKPVGGQSRLLEFDLTLDEGQTLIIDVYYGTTMVGGADVQSTLSGSSTAVTDMVLAAGQSAVTYDGGGSAPDITVLWRHAYL